MKYLLAAFVLALPGCATVMTGTSQRLAVETVPPGASCTLSRHGLPVGTVGSTPGTIEVSKGGSDLDIACTRPGYRPARQSVPIGLQGWLLGNALIGGLVGIVIDFSSGAAFHYPAGTMLAMQAAPYLGTPYSGTAMTGFAPGRWLAESSNPLVRPPVAATGDVTYAWGHSRE